MLLSVCRNVVNRCNTKEAVFSSVWAVVFFECQIPVHVSKLSFHFSCPKIDKNTGFRLRNAVQILRHMRSCHAICVALSCHRGCHQVGLKVIVFAYTCKICYAVLSFFIKLAMNLPSLFRSFDIERSEGRSSHTFPHISVAGRWLSPIRVNPYPTRDSDNIDSGGEGIYGV